MSHIYQPLLIISLVESGGTATVRQLANLFLSQDESQIQYYEKRIKENGFNVGMNCGQSAGQTIFHAHIHLIPRRNGDTPNPIGGVRGVIPDKMHYEVEK